MITYGRINVTISGQIGEIKSSRQTRLDFFTVTCDTCKDIILTGKVYSEEEIQDVIWKAIRAHHEEHLSRELAPR